MSAVTPSPAGAGRRRLDEHQRRGQIITAALAEMADHGYDRTTLTGVAARAGISKGLVWHYFTGKDDLMAATLTTVSTTIRDEIAASLDLDQPVPAVIRAALRRAADLTVSHRRELMALEDIVHNLRGDDGARVTPDFYEDTYRLQERLFRRGQDEGSLRAFDTRVMAVSYQGAIDMMLGYLRLHPDLDPGSYADSLADLLLDGMRAH